MIISDINTDPAIQLCADLVRIDTSNYGPDPRTVGEAEAAEYCVSFLKTHGYEPTMEVTPEGRANVWLAVEGANRELPTLIVHGHLDVVPAIAADWSVDPFGGIIKDGYLWGRGTVDMKNMVAMMLTVLADMKTRNWKPERRVLFLFVADEEAGGLAGMHKLIDDHPEIFAGATEAISEVGGYSVEVAGRRVYLIQTGEKGLDWMTLRATGRAGHGSQVNTDNAVTAIARAVAAIGGHRWDMELTPTVERLLRTVANLVQVEYGTDPETIEQLMVALGPARAFVEATLSSRANPTQLDAGYKVNVIPGEATAGIDLRPVPGREERDRKLIEEMAGESVTIESLHRDNGYEVPFDTDLVDQMLTHLRAEDPEAIIAPYLLSAGTDNKALQRVGVTGYGFVPAALPADFDFPAMFHGVDERIPLETLRFGTRVLARFLAGKPYDGPGDSR